jgi:hypothetical protein
MHNLQEEALIEQQSIIHCHVVKCIEFCSKEKNESFYKAEKEVIRLVYQFGALLLQLYLMSVHNRMSYTTWLDSGKYYLNNKLKYRVLKTFFGEVRYGRCYLIKKGGQGGFYPLDSQLTLTSDGFSPTVISLVTNLVTRVSFNSGREFFKKFCQWAPSTEAIQRLVLGLGKESSSYMEETSGRFEDDGEYLVLEFDGKATPTATEEELEKRRGKRNKSDKECSCGCQRHRGECKRREAGPKKRRKRGDKSKNGRSITLVAMYTLKKGEDGRLHGPVNKKIWGSYAARIEIMEWAEKQATARGFDPSTNSNIHIVIDGEKTLYSNLKKLFPQASFALDIRHFEEKLWTLGRTFHAEGSDELANWVNNYRNYLYTGEVEKLHKELEALKMTLSLRAKRDKKKLKELNALLKYLQPRIPMMNYKQFIDKDLVIASGVIEGAARYVVGERMDCSGMRWIPQRAEALLHLRCIELNGEWDKFFEWVYEQWNLKLFEGEKIMIRTNEGIDLGVKYQDAA